jgi:hypothetical protein
MDLSKRLDKLLNRLLIAIDDYLTESEDSYPLPSNYSDDYEKRSAESLRQSLRSFGLPISGKKSILVQRLRTYISSDSGKSGRKKE